MALGRASRVQLRHDVVRVEDQPQTALVTRERDRKFPPGVCGLLLLLVYWTGRKLVGLV